MRIKAGMVWLESGDTEDAIFEWDSGSMVDICTEDEYLVVRIDPADFIAIADAIVAAQKRESEKQMPLL